MKKNIPWIIIIILVVFTGFSLSRYIFLQKANLDLQTEIKNSKAKIDELVSQFMAEKELNQQLAKEKEGLSKELKSLSQQFRKAEAELSQAKDGLSSIQTKMNLLKKENIYLSQLKASFDEKMQEAKNEKEGLQAKLNSIDELKKAIRDFKEKMRQERIFSRKTNKPFRQIEIDGNKGYIVWRGQSTIKVKVKIEVIPAS